MSVFRVTMVLIAAAMVLVSVGCVPPREFTLDSELVDQVGIASVVSGDGEALNKISAVLGRHGITIGAGGSVSWTVFVDEGYGWWALRILKNAMGKELSEDDGIGLEKEPWFRTTHAEVALVMETGTDSEEALNSVFAVLAEAGIESFAERPPIFAIIVPREYGWKAIRVLNKAAKGALKNKGVTVLDKPNKSYAAVYWGEGIDEK